MVTIKSTYFLSLILDRPDCSNKQYSERILITHCYRFSFPSTYLNLL